MIYRVIVYECGEMNELYRRCECDRRRVGAVLDSA